MRLRLLLPDRILVDEEVTRLSVEAQDGALTLLPRHIDLVTALAPGILSFTVAGGVERHLAVDEGLLVKQGREVLVSASEAIPGGELGALRQAVEEHFRRLDERGQRTRRALARLEVDFARRLVELREHGEG